MIKSPKSINPVLSVVILNFNTGDYLQKCLQSIRLSDLDSKKYEIIVIDNASSDQSISLAKKVSLLNTKYLILNTNLGFAAGNNRALSILSPSSKFVLFLNPDTTVEPQTFSKMLTFFQENPKVDAATCYLKFALTGKLQPECHRDFPTPLTAMLHFTGISSRAYFMEYLDYSKIQKINACSGAFLMIKRSVGDSINWWNEKYFYYGEDLDLCYKLRQKGYSFYFYPFTQVTHYQGISSGIIKETQNISTASPQTRLRIALASTEAMRIFYQENLMNKYSPPVRFIVLSGIKLLELLRIFKAKCL
ncbi:MAG: glycosyltransferase family 2 protein [Candidatus Shapirobacteria bacterium]